MDSPRTHWRIILTLECFEQQINSSASVDLETGLKKGGEKKKRNAEKKPKLGDSLMHGGAFGALGEARQKAPGPGGQLIGCGLTDRRIIVTPEAESQRDDGDGLAS